MIRKLFGLRLHKSLKAEEGDETIEVHALGWFARFAAAGIRVQGSAQPVGSQALLHWGLKPMRCEMLAGVSYAVSWLVFLTQRVHGAVV